jgi:hypothetical protein
MNTIKYFMRKMDDYNDKIEIEITWRFIFYIIFMLITAAFVSNAIYYHYEVKWFALFVYILYVMSYLYSIYLIRRR